MALGGGSVSVGVGGGYGSEAVESEASRCF